MEGAPTPDCRWEECAGCGACPGEGADDPAAAQVLKDGDAGLALPPGDDPGPGACHAPLRPAPRLHPGLLAPTRVSPAPRLCRWGWVRAGEYLEVGLDREVETGGLAERINRDMPEGLRVLSAELLPEHFPKMSRWVHYALYRVEPEGGDGVLLALPLAAAGGEGEGEGYPEAARRPGEARRAGRLERLAAARHPAGALRLPRRDRRGVTGAVVGGLGQGSSIKRGERIDAFP